MTGVEPTEPRRSLVPVPVVTGYSGLREIGRGGFAVVYEALQDNLDRRVAVKLLARLDANGHMVERFLRESRTMAALDWHPHVVTIFDTGVVESTGTPYLVMEYLPHGSLADRIARDGAMDWTDVVRVGIQLADALHAAHTIGVIHRDVKPENALVDRTGVVKLADFGIAAVASSVSGSTGVVTGTLAHSAPEVISGSRATARSDVYSLGSTLFTLLTGQPAFVRPTDESFVQVAVRALHDPLPDLRIWGVPDFLAGAVEWLMRRDPAERPASALDAARALQRVEQAAAIPTTRIFSAAGPVALGVDQTHLGTTVSGLTPDAVNALVRATPTPPPFAATPWPATPGTALATPAISGTVVFGAGSALASTTAGLGRAPRRRRNLIALAATIAAVALLGVGALVVVDDGGSAASSSSPEMTPIAADEPAESSPAGSGGDASGSDGASGGAEAGAGGAVDGAAEGQGEPDGDIRTTGATERSSSSTSTTRSRLPAGPVSAGPATGAGTPTSAPRPSTTANPERPVTATTRTTGGTATTSDPPGPTADTTGAPGHTGPTVPTTSPSTAPASTPGTSTPGTSTPGTSTPGSTPGSSTTTTSTQPVPPDTCLSGFVWRLANAFDHVCVTPATADRVAADNATAPQRLLGLIDGPFGPDTCKNGYVWRDAFANDHVCVSPPTRDQVAADNAAASSRVDPLGAFGPSSCVTGYVWREARPSDLVCVDPSQRTLAAQDNAAASSRLLGKVYGDHGPDTCMVGYVWREASPSDLVCVDPSQRDQARADNAAAASRRVG